ncbi:DJ-1 family glyoxalase III [Mariniphaga sediminis]|uniref:DJ-1 family glyoxalase III n=1 Tax=Mariniphaga sediminis TaxID=1628158 RepID=UPI0035643896
METKVAVHLAEGFEEIEAVSIIDVLRRAAIETVVVSVTGKPEVTGSHDITITADQLFEEVDYNTIEMIVLPGGLPGANNLKKHTGLNNRIIDFHKNGKPLGAICAAPLVLGHLGILKNQKATCFPGFEDQLTGAEVTGAEVETSGEIITGKGAGVAIKFALKIVESLKGKEMADTLAKKMIFKP